MERDRERDGAPGDLVFAEPSPEAPSRSGAPPGAASAHRVLPFDLIDATQAQPVTPPRSLGWLVAALALAALVCVALVKSLVLRALLPLALAAAAIAVVMRGRRSRPAPPRPTRRLVLSATGLRFEADGAERELLADGAPFGATLVATRRRDRAVLALSSEHGTFYVGATFDGASRRAHTALLSRAATVASDELGLDAAGPDGDRVLLAPADLAALFDALVARDPRSAERIVLSDETGAPLVLDAQELRIRDVRFDLTLPLEWRAIVFQQTFGHGSTVYQGTWIRQGAAQVTLVALWPSIGAAPTASDLESAGVPELDRAAVRDLRLLQAAPEDPPPAAPRVAVDRLFVPSLRGALDRAPRASRPTSRARA